MTRTRCPRSSEAARMEASISTEVAVGKESRQETAIFPVAENKGAYFRELQLRIRISGCAHLILKGSCRSQPGTWYPAVVPKYFSREKSNNALFFSTSPHYCTRDDARCCAKQREKVFTALVLLIWQSTTQRKPNSGGAFIISWVCLVRMDYRARCISLVLKRRLKSCE